MALTASHSSLNVNLTPNKNPAHLAREVVQAALQYSHLPDPPPEEFYRRRAACFVSIKKQGGLRGCIGTLDPAETDLAREIIRNAQSAAFADPRFPPVVLAEVTLLSFSVDVLSAPERIDSHQELDCKKYGVIVGCDYRRGVLLPDLEGVDSIERQLEIACQKAGIYPGDKFDMHRFTVVRYDENWNPGQLPE